jgi:hypothetical protein
MAVPGPALTVALPEKVWVVQFEVPARRVDTVVPDATNVPAGVAATGTPELSCTFVCQVPPTGR